MASVFPGALDNLGAAKAEATEQAVDHPTHHNDLANAVNAVQQYLINGDAPFAFGEAYRFDQDLDEDVPVLWLGNYEEDPDGPNVNAILVLHGAYSNADNLVGQWIGPLASANTDISVLTGSEVVLYTATTVTGITGAATAYNADFAPANAGTTARAVGYQSALSTSYPGGLVSGHTVTFMAQFVTVAPVLAVGSAITSYYAFHSEHVASAGTNNVHLFLGASGVVAPTVSGNYALASESTFESYLSGLLRLAASTTARASLRIPHGTAPTSPVNGDMWTTTSGLLVQINGVTKTVTLT